MMRIANCMTAILFVGLLSSHAAAAMVGETFRYDGSYDPASGSPPAGQSTWLKQEIGSASLTPNSPSAGIATFIDPNNSSRVRMSNAFMASTFPTNEATNPTIEWEYSFDFRVLSRSGNQSVLFGVRDEGDNGRAIMFSIASSNTNLFWTNAAGNGVKSGDSLILSGPGIPWSNPHTLRVVKKDIGGTMTVTTYFDGLQVDQQPYSDFPLDNNTVGFGIFSGTSQSSSFEIDNVYFGQVVPEPEGIMIALLGCAGLCLLWRRRRQRLTS